MNRFIYHYQTESRKKKDKIYSLDMAMCLLSVSNSGGRLGRGALLLLSAALGCAGQLRAAGAQSQWLGPCAEALEVGGRLFVACERAGEVIAIDMGSWKPIWQLTLGAAPTGLAVTANPPVITVAAERGMVFCADPGSGRITSRWKAGAGKAFGCSV
ncbi:MAG TPA: hypothetical protein VJA21_19110 [Verrucomicrobiae bacterium]